MAEPKIRMDIQANAEGAPSVEQLARRLEELGKTLEGDLGESARHAGVALREALAGQDAMAGVTMLRNSVTESGKTLKQAEVDLKAYRDTMKSATMPTAEMVAGEERLAAAVKRAREVLDGKKASLKQAEVNLAGYGLATTNAGAATEKLDTAIKGAHGALARLDPSYRVAGASAVASADQQVAAATRVTGGLQGITDNLRTVQTLALTALGGGMVGGMIKDVAQLADQYATLSSRVRLVTGDGPALQSSMEAVEGIALRTGAALDTTATLFARLTQAGKDAGLNTEAAINQLLALVETIGQAAQLSGGSAESANAAITQLIQGLQSGVLRGDEFNSVMEQSPRLARALADGLGVTVGKLREMAQAGQLSSATVISALQGQAQAVQAEFEKLPLTIGRAVQNLSTAWTAYIGQADQAAGASKRVADIINALSANLDTLIGLLLDAGQAAAAFAALRLAQAFLGLGTAASAAATGVVATNTALASTAAVSAGAAAGVARLAMLFRTLRTFTLIGLVTNLKDIGTWLGEGIAKLQGYRDRTKEVEAGEKARAQAAREMAAAQAALEQKMRLTADAAAGVSTEARKLIGDFDQMRAKGKSTTDALVELGKAFDLKSLKGINDAATALQKLSADGKIASAELKQAWATALDGKDLLQFETAARAAFAGTRGEAEKLATLMDSVLDAAVKRTGLSYSQLKGEMSDATRSAINDVDAVAGRLDQLAQKGVDAGRVLGASLSKAINTADSTQAIDELVSRVQQFRDLLGQDVSSGLLDQAATRLRGLRQAAEDATPGINSTAEAMRQLGVTSDAALTAAAGSARRAYQTMVSEGRASTRELDDAFRKAAEAAIKAANGVAPVWVRLEAAARGYRLEVDRAGESHLVMADKAGTGAARVQAAFDRMGVKTQGQLSRAATQAAQDFSTIESSGQATADGLQSAFKRYAEAAIAANGGVASDTLAQQAAQHGLAIAYDKTGKAVVKTAAEMGDAMQNAMRQGNEAIEGQMGYLERLAKRNAEVQSSIKKDANGFAVDEKGNTIGQERATWLSVFNMLKGMGIDEGQAREIAGQAYNADGTWNSALQSSQMRHQYDSIDVYEAARRAAEKIIRQDGTGVAGAAAPVPGAKSSEPPAKPAGQGGARNVNVSLNLNGKAFGTVRTDGDGERALQSMLGALQRAASAAA